MTIPIEAANQMVFSAAGGIATVAVLVIAVLGLWYAIKYRQLEAEVKQLRAENEAIRRTITEIVNRPVEVNFAQASRS